MKKFCLRLSVFLLVFSMVLGAVDYLSATDTLRVSFAKLTNSEALLGYGSDEIRPYIIRAQTPDDTKILLIGDSVCRQIFSGLQQYNPDIAMLGSNASFSVAGQYILVSEYLKSHPDATDVYLVLLPVSLMVCFYSDIRLGYQYLVMPSVETGTLDLLDENTVNDLKRFYGAFFLHPTVANLIDKSGLNRKVYLNRIDQLVPELQTSWSYTLGEQYLTKISGLCQEKGVRLHLYPCPVSEVWRARMEQYLPMYESTSIDELFPEFWSYIHYYPAEASADGGHFSGSYANQTYYNQIIRDTFAGTELLDIIRFE